MDNRLATLRRVLRVHFNWLTLKLLGKDLLSKEELKELKDYGRLPMGDEVGLIEHSFALGRQSALSKKSEYKDLTLDKLSRLQKKKYSSVEELAIREAKLHAARRIQALADNASAAAYARLNTATRDMLADAAAKDILTDEVALGVAERKTREQLATSIANKLGRDFSADMKKLAVTEMHRAKTRGAAMAIANKVGIYQRSDGPDSSVSVVPNRGACGDCRSLYLDETGNPRVFKLKTLVAQGSNADEGVSHTRGAGGLHTGWKPVMPPAHPNCYCELTYVPPGMAWENGKLKVADALKYQASISKAYDPGSMSATVKPKGGNSYQGNKPPKVASIPGVPAPGNEAGPGRTPELAATAPVSSPGGGKAATEPMEQQQAGAGQDDRYNPCIFGGGDECSKHGGDGAMRHEKGGKIEREHLKHKAKVQTTLDPTQVALKLQEIKDSDVMSFTPAQVGEWLRTGTVIARKDIKDIRPGPSAGITSREAKVQKVDLMEGISLLEKPKLPGKAHFNDAEVGAFTFASLFGRKNESGGNGRVCHTEYRINDEGTESVGQAWVQNSMDGYAYASALIEVGAYRGCPKNRIDAYHMVKAIKEHSPDWPQLRAHIEETIATDVLLANADRHAGNLIFDKEGTRAHAIDHGFTFARGANAYRQTYHEGMKANNMPVRIPDEMAEKLDNTTFEQMLTKAGERLATWKVAQTYLRGKWMQHIQDSFGELNYHAVGGGRGDGADNTIGMMEVIYGTEATHYTEGNASFEKFALSYLDHNASSPDYPDHAVAKQLLEEGVFMNTLTDPISRSSGDAERRRGDQFAYEKFIRSHHYLMTKEAKTAGHAKEADRAWWMNPERADIETKWNTALLRYKKEHQEINYQRGYQKPSPSEQAALQHRERMNNLEYDLDLSQRDQAYFALKSRILANFVPPGQEERFKELDYKIAKYKSGNAPLPLKLNTGVVPGKAKDAQKPPRNLGSAVRRLKEAGPINVQTEESEPGYKKPNAAAQEPKSKQPGWSEFDTPVPFTYDTGAFGTPEQNVVEKIRAATQGEATNKPTAASVIQGSKTIRAQEVALSHADKMVRDAKRQLKGMKRDVPAARKNLQKKKIAQLQERHKKMESQIERMKQRKAVRYKE